MPKWKELYDFLEGKEGCNFREVKGETTWNCDGSLKKTKKFCKQHNLNFKAVKAMCEEIGGYCDCEVLWNTEDKISGRKEMPKRRD